MAWEMGCLFAERFLHSRAAEAAGAALGTATRRNAPPPRQRLCRELKEMRGSNAP
jgi:hypothetical protein